MKKLRKFFTILLVAILMVVLLNPTMMATDISVDVDNRNEAIKSETEKTSAEIDEILENKEQREVKDFYELLAETKQMQKPEITDINSSEKESNLAKSQSNGISLMSTDETYEEFESPLMYGFDTPIYSDSGYYYAVTLNLMSKMPFKIERYSIKERNEEILYTSENDSLAKATYVRGDIIYVAYLANNDGNGGTFDEVSVMKFDTTTLQATELGTYNAIIHGADAMPSFAVDSEERLYFVSDYTDVRVFEKTGKMIYSYEPDAEDEEFEVVINGISPNDKALFFSMTTDLHTNYPYNIAEGVQNIKDGKFVYEEAYTVFGKTAYYVENPDWVFLDDEGNYAVNQYGEIVQFIYDIDNNMGVTYRILQDFKRTVYDYVQTKQSTTSYVKIGNNYYIPGDRNIIFVVDSNFNRVGKIDLGIGTDEDRYEIEGMNTVDGDLYVRYYKPEEYGRKYIIIPDAESKIQEFKDIIYTKHSTQNHTKKEIKEKYDATVSYDYSQSIYKEKPSATAPYVAGSLQDGVVNDTLNRINFYRWLYGIDEVSINEDKMERNQKGAVLLKASGEFSHEPSQPADMDDEFYNEAYDGCNAKAEAGDTYSGNISYGNRAPYEAVDGYVNDMSNISTMYGAVGHRMSILDPRATEVSFGDCDTYSTLSMYYDPSISATSLPEDFYSYPSAGYFPSEQFYTNQYWSLYVTESVSSTENTKFEFIYNGKSYEADGVRTESSYPAIDFKMPIELMLELGGSYKTMPTTSIEVRISNLANNDGDNVTYNYTVNFFSMDKILEGIELNKTELSIARGGSETLQLTLTPNNAEVTEEAKWTSSNPEVATVEDGVVKAVSEGTTTITVELEGYTKTCEVTVTKYKKGDIDRSGKVTATDGFLAYDIYLHETPLTDEDLEIGDVDESGRMTAMDAFIIYDAYLHEIEL